MEYHMLYVKSRKNFEMRREKRFITLLCEKHTANLLLCRVPIKTDSKAWPCLHMTKRLMCARQKAHSKDPDSGSVKLYFQFPQFILDIHRNIFGIFVFLSSLIFLFRDDLSLTQILLCFHVFIVYICVCLGYDIIMSLFVSYILYKIWVYRSVIRNIGPNKNLWWNCYMLQK